MSSLEIISAWVVRPVTCEHPFPDIVVVLRENGACFAVRGHFLQWKCFDESSRDYGKPVPPELQQKITELVNQQATIEQWKREDAHA